MDSAKKYCIGFGAAVLVVVVWQGYSLIKGNPVQATPQDSKATPQDSKATNKKEEEKESKLEKAKYAPENVKELADVFLGIMEKLALAAEKRADRETKLAKEQADREMKLYKEGRDDAIKEREATLPKDKKKSLAKPADLSKSIKSFDARREDLRQMTRTNLLYQYRSEQHPAVTQCLWVFDQNTKVIRQNLIASTSSE